MADEVQQATQGATANSPTIEAQLAEAQAAVVELQRQMSALQFEVKQLQVQTALAVKPSSSGGTPSMTALLRRLDAHGIRVQPGDEDDPAGSGSERWGSAAWTEAGDGTVYPAA